MITQKTINDLTYRVIGCAIEVHRAFGPGLLESIYQDCLVRELKLQKISFASQKEILLNYKGHELRRPLRLDLIIEDLLIVELKAVEIMHPVYQAQLLTYLKLADKPKGLLINFNVENIARDGLISMVTEKFRSLKKE